MYCPRFADIFFFLLSSRYGFMHAESKHPSQYALLSLLHRLISSLTATATARIHRPLAVTAAPFHTILLFHCTTAPLRSVQGRWALCILRVLHTVQYATPSPTYCYCYGHADDDAHAQSLARVCLCAYNRHVFLALFLSSVEFCFYIIQFARFSRLCLHT